MIVLDDRGYVWATEVTTLNHNVCAVTLVTPIAVGSPIPVGDHARPLIVAWFSVVSILWGDSPCEPSPKSHAHHRCSATFDRRCWEPSGETAPPPSISSTSASFCVSPPSIGIEPHGGKTRGTDRSNESWESGNQLPNCRRLSG